VTVTPAVALYMCRCITAAASAAAAAAAAACPCACAESLVVLDGVGVLLVSRRGCWTGQSRQFLDLADIHSVFVYEVRGGGMSAAVRMRSFWLWSGRAVCRSSCGEMQSCAHVMLTAAAAAAVVAAAAAAVGTPAVVRP
jgi:hypothetical protein